MDNTIASSTSPDSQPNPEANLSSTSGLSVVRVSCVTCRRRKVKCDKLSPCSHCLKSQIHCEYTPRKRAPKRPRKGIDSAREAELLSRLHKLEGKWTNTRGTVIVQHKANSQSRHSKGTRRTPRYPACTPPPDPDFELCDT